MQNFISIGSVVSEPLGSGNHNLPFVWVTALTTVYASDRFICVRLVIRCLVFSVFPLCSLVVSTSAIDYLERLVSDGDRTVLLIFPAILQTVNTK